MGLGSFEDVSLSDARDLRDGARHTRNTGRNPIEVRRAERKGLAGRKTFGDVAEELLKAKAPEWGNKKHADQWRVSLEDGAAALASTNVEAVDTEAVLGVLKKVWTETPESASRLRQRIEAVLDYAGAHGLRTGDNPARWRGHLEHLLPKRGRGDKGHHAALPYGDVPGFMTRLRAVETIAARALEFLILTAARSGEVYGATWSEIDAIEKVWTVSASRMKAGRVHRVPLAPQAIAVIEKARPFSAGEFIFEGRRRGHPLSHIAMAKVIDRMSVEGATPHGFRSSFRDWCGDHTEFPREVAEAALAHSVGDAAEQAYRRGDALDKRRALMNAWAKYCGGSDSK